MATRKQCAEAFVKCDYARCHNAETSNGEYRLHGHLIAVWAADGETVQFYWRGWHTITTAAHMNEILKAMKADVRVSAAKARDEGQEFFTVTLP